MSFRKTPEQQEQDSNSVLMCCAQGCPMRWSVDAPDKRRLCSYHAWEPVECWPSITEGLVRCGPWRLPVATGSKAVQEMRERIRGRLQPPTPSL